jgi:amino acid adenylation domain-containing protein
MTQADPPAGERILLPASYAQERLWFLAQLEPNATRVYQMCVRVDIYGPLDRVRFQEAVNHVIARHEILRSGVTFVDGTLYQLVLPSAAISVPTIQCGNLGTESRESRIRSVAAEENTRPFALEQPPLLRLTLLEFSSQQHTVILSIHHLTCDRWSLDVMLRDLAHAYAASESGVAARWPELSIQYADYAGWQRSKLNDAAAIDAELQFWKKSLGDLEPINLTTDFPRPVVRSGASGVCRSLVPKGSLAAVERCAREHQASLFMTLLSAFGIVLRQFSGQREFAIGTVIANRDMPQTENVIGPFSNTLALRMDFTDNRNFGELLRWTRQMCLDAYSHRAIPFERIVQELRPVRDLSRTPIFQVFLALQEERPPAISFGSLELHAHQGFGIGNAVFDLALNATPGESGLELALEYSKDLFEPKTAEAIMRHFVWILSAASSMPDVPLTDLAFAANEEYDEQLALGMGEACCSSRKRVDELIAEQAVRVPSAIAIEHDSVSVSYEQLLHQVEQVADQLLSAGIGQFDFVSVCMERSSWLLPVLLAVWRVGAAYVPVDPRYPADRIAQMLAEFPVVVTTAHIADQIRVPGLRLLLIDKEPDQAAVPGNTARRPEQGGPGEIAYAIYTSGSTGQPKAVEVSHGALANLLEAMRAELRLAEPDTLVAVTSLSFDIAALELFLPLICGGRVVIAPREVITDGRALSSLTIACGATTMQATPNTWRLLLEAGWQPPSGFRVLCGGEAMDADLAGRLLACGVQLWNLYGPTETTVWTSAGKVNNPRRIRLGRCLANTTRYLLDEELRLVPCGAAGELYVGGAGVAAGYHAASAATAARFLPDPFCAAPARRMYRTGDLCRYDSDGELEFLGRADQQVKIRGFRVQPQEIEDVLVRHPDVRQVAVVEYRLSAEDARLAVFVVLDGAPSAGVPQTQVAPQYAGGSGCADSSLSEQLRDLAARHLPDYMVPALFITRAALPLNSAGKVDRRALGQIALAAAPVSEDRTPPRTATERMLAEFFADLLNAPKVGVLTSFFDFGGHSLLAARLINLIDAHLGVRLPVAAVFASPTVASLARRVDEQRGHDLDSGTSTAARVLVAGMSDEEVDKLLHQTNPAAQS